ncbi:hypothetical protein MLD38_024573 [Melastoma candidum]|uniref:Uncharacterized protein n=1 Tax=Melastoma candidum TaxID=119954 RepID=A0ACB9NUE7_9MYRT|nr:hypothetical protein MLD38_024573 [Melastoma candidum]
MDSSHKRRGFIKGDAVVHQDRLSLTPHHQQKHKMSFMIPDKGVEMTLVHCDKLFGTAGDEAVDVKATRYISTVQERFKLEYVNSGRIVCGEAP